MSEQEVRRIVALYKEGVKHYDKVINTERSENGFSQTAIDLFDGKVNIDDLVIKYMMEEINTEKHEHPRR